MALLCSTTYQLKMKGLTVAKVQTGGSGCGTISESRSRFQLWKFIASWWRSVEAGWWVYSFWWNDALTWEPSVWQPVTQCGLADHDSRYGSEQKCSEREILENRWATVKELTHNFRERMVFLSRRHFNELFHFKAVGHTAQMAKRLLL